MIRFWLSDENNISTKVFPIGSTLFIEGRGLHPSTLYDFHLSDESRDGAATLLARYSTDRHGVLPATALIPYVGVFKHDQTYLQFDTDAHGETAGRTLTIRAKVSGEPRPDSEQLKFTVMPRNNDRWIFSCDANGQMQTGIEQGRGPISIALRNFPAGCVRVYLVPRQFGWRAGDPIDPIATRNGSICRRVFRHDGSAETIVNLADSDEIPAGSYQFIARSFPLGWYEAEEPRLLADDVVSDRRFASLVIRLPFNKRFGYDNGIVLTPEISGRPLAHRPYFRFVNNFPIGTDVYAALDPDALPAGLVGKRAAIYVIRHQTAAQWSMSSMLDDISGPGMTSAPKIVPIVPGCVNWNTTLVWPNPQVPGKYDIAIDFGNNAPNAQDFISDGSLDPPLDMIDGYVRVGFYVTEDPSLPGQYLGKIGQHDYALGSIQVPSTDAGPTPTDSLPITATVRYPAQSSGTDAAFAPGSFPLVVIMHGNSGYDTSYLGYNYLLDHLASHGFIAMSIYAPVGVMIETRARAILAHLSIMSQNNANPGLFQGHIDMSHIGIAGHSRGGEAVVRAARINTAEGLGWNIQAGISIAPTDYFHYGDPGMPLLVIYGSNDGDVAGTWPDRTCFNIYDEAGRPRSFIFVYGATHDQFNTVWAPTFLNVESDITSSDIPKLISLNDHENVAKGYVTAFMQAHLQARDEQLEYFSANLKPVLVGSLQIHTSHQESGVRSIDNFEQTPHNPNVNTLGGGVITTALSALAENALRTLDVHSPHVTGGGEIAWQSFSGRYSSQLPLTAKDVSGYAVLAFRITQKYGSAENPFNLSQDLFVRLTDGGGKSRAIRVSTFTDVPFPYERGFTDLIKSALKSVRIPLSSFTISNLGAEDVDLTNVASVSFEFGANPTGRIEIDDIEFTQ